VFTSTTSPGVKRPRLQPQTVKAIAPAIIRLVISDWPMLSQASEVSFLTAARRRRDRLAVAPRLALLGAEIFDRLVVEQRIDRAADRAGCRPRSSRAAACAPVGDDAGEGDVGDDHHQRRDDQAGPNFTQKMTQMIASSMIVGAMLNSRK
jgi:hypothetical protein